MHILVSTSLWVNLRLTFTNYVERYYGSEALPIGFWLRTLIRIQYVITIPRNVRSESEMVMHNKIVGHISLHFQLKTLRENFSIFQG